MSHSTPEAEVVADAPPIIAETRVDIPDCSVADAVMMRDGGIVTEPAARLYDRAWRLDPSQHRAGLLAALPAYEAGDIEAAEAHWAKVKEDMAPDDPLFGMLEAFKSRIDEANLEESGTER